MRQHIPDHIIERAVELWCRALRNPIHDNGDQSFTGAFTAVLADIVTTSEIGKVSDFEAAVSKFRTVLVERLKFNRDHDMEFTGGTNERGEPERYYFSHHLAVDYHPCRDLAEAAKEAGIPKSAFSIKSTVSFFGPDYVSARFGYSADEIYHYPLSAERWLLCRLYGQDMPQILAAVEAGTLTGFEIEEAATAAEQVPA